MVRQMDEFYEDKVEFFRDKDDQIRWRFIAMENGEPMAICGQGYTKDDDALHAVFRVTGRMPDFSYTEEDYPWTDRESIFAVWVTPDATD